MLPQYTDSLIIIRKTKQQVVPSFKRLEPESCSHKLLKLDFQTDKMIDRCQATE